MPDNTFGNLIRAYRKQRQWTQAQLADRWGYTSEYVSQVETGKRKLDSMRQVASLANILDIPQEKLEAIGRGIPERKKPAKPGETDNKVLQMLLTPGRDMVRMSWIVWQGDQHPAIENNLQNVIIGLEAALLSYHGEFVKPAQQLLAYAHQMKGKMALERLDYAAGAGHFSEMIDLGERLNDSEIIAVGLIQQADLLRKRGRYEMALKCFEKASAYIDVSALSIQGMKQVLMSRAYYIIGLSDEFNRSIDNAFSVISNIREETIDNIANRVTLLDILEEQAAGHTTLWKPEKAIAIYEKIDRSFRPLRNQGSYLIDKAQAYFTLGEYRLAEDLAEQGIKLAETYRSKRHIARLEATYTRLLNTPLGKGKRLRGLRNLLVDVDQSSW